MSGDREDGKRTAAEEPVDQTTALEQWKFYGQTTLNVSNRRLKNNRFYLRLLIALLGIAGIGTKIGFITPIGLLVIGIVGLPFCVLWSFHILSYKQLNSGKYRVMWEMAEELPFDPFKREWTKLKEGQEPQAYIKHTTVEVWWPRVFGLFYAGLIAYGVLSLTGNMAVFIPVVAVLFLLWVVYAVMVLRGKSPSQRYWDYTGE
jgi:Flp pilus assembly protein TadB